MFKRCVVAAFFSTIAIYPSTVNANDVKPCTWIDRVHGYKIEIFNTYYKLCHKRSCERGRLETTPGGSLLLKDFRNTRIGKRLLKDSGMSEFLKITLAGKRYPESLIFPAVLEDKNVCNGRKYF